MILPLEKWRSWNSAGYELRRAFDLAAEWLDDFGINITASGVDGVAATNRPDTIAFRVDRFVGGPTNQSLVLLVTIDEDPPARATRVEIRRG